MREEFRNIVTGWTLISGIEDITDKIEQVAKWAETNSPLEPDEEATVKLMIECQIARSDPKEYEIILTCYECNTPPLAGPYCPKCNPNTIRDDALEAAAKKCEAFYYLKAHDLAQAIRSMKGKKDAKA